MSTSKPWPFASRPPAIAGAMNRPLAIQPRPIQMIGAWRWKLLQEIERQDVVELDAVEGLALVIGVRHDRARALRGEEHQRDDEEIFAAS